jgi:hypothetical protein
MILTTQAAWQLRTTRKHMNALMLLECCMLSLNTMEDVCCCCVSAVRFLLET